jgi:glycosyltransferase involved in cell wall biosynthesis
VLLVDLSHTSHTRARTGVQRVTRELLAALHRQRPTLAMTYDPYAGQWRPLEHWEKLNLEAGAAPPTHGRGARWPLAARWRGRLRRWRGRSPPPLPPTRGGLIVPEIFSPAVGAALPGLMARVTGPRVAVFHDALALELPDLAPPKTVARMPGYLRELARFDGVAAVSADSARSLAHHWAAAGLSNCPSIHPLPLGVNPPADPGTARRMVAPPGEPVVLCVATLEGRKNHLALLEAAERLWAGGAGFTLRLIGLAHPETGRAALARLRQLQAAGRPLRYDGPVDEATLAQAYATCAFTVYPSLREGFGLPVIESLQHGKPCICSSEGALGESARGGGCLTVDPPDADGLAAAMARLLHDQTARAELAREARARTFRTWDDCARDLLAWMPTLRRRE